MHLTRLSEGKENLSANLIVCLTCIISSLCYSLSLIDGLSELQ